jgi:hypothetical protein
MKCPKCGYTSFDHNDTCPKCKKNISDTRAKLNLPNFAAGPISAMAHGNAHDSSAADGIRDPRIVSPVPLTAGYRKPGDVPLKDSDLIEEATALDITLDDLTLKPDPPDGSFDLGGPAVVDIDALASDISEIDLAIESLDEEDLEPIGQQRGPAPNSKPGSGVMPKGADMAAAGKELSLDLENMDLDLDLDLDAGKKK